MNLPDKPNPLDPRTPAVMCWEARFGATYPEVVKLVYRRSQDLFLVNDGARWVPATGLGVPLGFVVEWHRFKFSRSVRVTLLGYRTGRSDLYRCTPGAHTKGMVLADPTAFKRVRAQYRGFAPLIKDALDARKSGSYREERDTLSECVRHANDNLGSGSRGDFVDALRDAFADRGYDCPVNQQGCGHAEHEGSATTDHRGCTYCEDCAEELRYIDGEYYTGGYCYYWESDGEYHTSEEPEDEEEEEEEEEEEPNSDLVRNWGASTSRLDHAVFPQSPHSDFTMGVELEVECESSREYHDAVQDCQDHFNADYSYAMFKKDGSLSDQGFEIVTAARRLGDHITAFKEWEPHDTLRAWKPGTCGVHVHIDSRAFSALTLGKFLMFINADVNIPLITAIAGRHPKNDSAAQNYCAQIDQEVLTDPLKVLKGNNNTRYRMVNLTNLTHSEQGRLAVTNTHRDCKGDYSTVELRIFRASLKKERLLAQIEFAHAAVMFCRTASWHGLTGNDFKAWLATGAALQYKNLARWFGIRVPKVDKRPTTPAVRQELEAECA